MRPSYRGAAVVTWPDRDLSHKKVGEGGRVGWVVCGSKARNAAAFGREIRGHTFSIKGAKEESNSRDWGKKTLA